MNMGLWSSNCPPNPHEMDGLEARSTNLDINVGICTILDYLEVIVEWQPEVNVIHQLSYLLGLQFRI
jgi:hypothetical protein